MAVGNLTVYLKGDTNVEMQTTSVTLGDIVEIECTNSQIATKLKCLKILKIPPGKQKRYVVSILKIIEKIHEEYPSVEIQNMGAQDIIVTYEPMQKHNQLLVCGKVFLVMVIVFIGAAFSIMAFNNDVDVSRLFSQIYGLVMGRPKKGYTILEASYSIGIVIGILAFFNHFGKKRFSVDPTPLEVEMRMYETEIQTTLIENYARKEQELDVGKGNSSGNHGT